MYMIYFIKWNDYSFNNIKSNKLKKAYYIEILAL